VDVVVGVLDDEQGGRGADRRGRAVLIGGGDDELEAEVGGEAEELIASGDVLFPNAVACVERLAAAFPLGIASGALRHEIQAILARGGIAERFRFIVASGDTPASKPAPDPYRRAAELHGLPPSACLAIEDTRWGIESARAAGLACLGLATTCDPAELVRADLVIDSLDAIDPALVRRL